MEYKKYLPEIILAAVITVFAGIIIIPSISKCIGNDKKSDCRTNMYAMLNVLSRHIAGEGVDGEWHNMILNGQSDNAVEILADEAGREYDRTIDSSDYYFERRENILYTRCKDHHDIVDISLVLANVPAEEEKLTARLGWNANTERKIADTSIPSGNSFVVDAGTDGRYCVSARSWDEYVADAMAENGKTYNSSLVFYNGAYYYPDGFNIVNYLENTDPINYAMDIDLPSNPAYFIPVDTAAAASGRFSEDAHDGSLMIERGSIYIWQSRPSKRLSGGWIKMECEIKKL